MSALFFWLLVGHSLADFPLQGDFIARGKNRHIKPTNIPPGQTPQTIWPYCLTAHAFIHAGFVAALTGSIGLGVAELMLHWLIDFAKCENWTGIHTDQALHIACKIAWVALV